MIYLTVMQTFCTISIRCRRRLLLLPLPSLLPSSLTLLSSGAAAAAAVFALASVTASVSVSVSVSASLPTSRPFASRARFLASNLLTFN